MSHDFYSIRTTQKPRPAETMVKPRPGRPLGRHASLVILGLAVAAAASALALLPLRGGNDTPANPAEISGPTIVSQTHLVRFASSLDYPVWWTGPHAGYSYELTAARGRAWVRYLPAGVKAGDPHAGFLVVGTYEEPRAYANLKRAAKRPGIVSTSIAGGGLVVYNRERPTSVYFSYPGAKYQVEVYAPSAQTARRLVLDGKIIPVE